jgi:hypothetical protein
MSIAYRLGRLARIDDNAIGAVGPGLLNPIDDRSLPVAEGSDWSKRQHEPSLISNGPLKKVNLSMERFGLLGTFGDHIFEGVVSVDLRLAQAEEIEVGPVDDQDCLLSVAHSGSSGDGQPDSSFVLFHRSPEPNLSGPNV